MTMPVILSGPAGRALKALEPVADFDLAGREFAHWAGTQTINSTKDDLLRALGPARQPGFSSELHAAITNLRNDVRVEASLTQISSAMTELDGAANATALRRGTAALGLATAAVGSALLVRQSMQGGGSGPVPMAPGPIGAERPTPLHT